MGEGEPRPLAYSWILHSMVLCLDVIWYVLHTERYSKHINLSKHEKDQYYIFPVYALNTWDLGAFAVYALNHTNISSSFTYYSNILSFTIPNSSSLNAQAC